MKPRPSKYLRMAMTMRSSSSTIRMRRVICSCCAFIITRHPYPDDCSPEFMIFCSNYATVLIHDSLGDGQPQTGAAAAAREERLEDPRKIVFPKARPAIGDADLDRFLVRAQRHLDGRLARRVLRRVGDQVLERVYEPLRIHEQRRVVLGVQRDRDAVRRRSGPAEI